MAERDILSEYGPEAKSDNRASNGGQCDCKELPYDPPKGPKGQMHESPGLGGEVLPCGTQGRR